MKTTPRKFSDQIGRKKIAAAVGVVPSAVANAIDRDVFPASWFIACKSLADEVGIDCPHTLFGMRVNELGDPAPAVQEGDAA